MGCFKILLKQNRILNALEGMRFKEGRTRSLAAVFKCIDNQQALEFLIKIRESSLATNQMGREDEVKIFNRILNDLSEAKEKESYDFDPALIEGMKSFIDSVEIEQAHKGAGMMRELRKIRKSLEKLQPSVSKKRAL